MASITRKEFLNETADTRLETAITSIMSDYRAGWVSGSATVTDIAAQLELRREVLGIALNRLTRMLKRKGAGYTA